MARSAPPSLFEFDREIDYDWSVVNDGVMGGRSAGFVTIEAGTLRFTGTLVTQGGGFTSVRAPRAIDLSGMVGLEMRVRGSGRQFEVEVDDGLRSYGRSVSRRAPFPSTSEWTVIRVPFDALRSSIFGRSVDAAAIDLARIRGVGLYLADGKDGEFRLEVDYIRAYALPSTRPASAMPLSNAPSMRGPPHQSREGKEVIAEANTGSVGFVPSAQTGASA